LFRVSDQKPPHEPARRHIPDSGKNRSTKRADQESGSDFLRRKYSRDLADTSTGGITEESSQLTKFHGVYAQDDAICATSAARRAKEKAFSFMARVRVPGGGVHDGAVARPRRARGRWANGSAQAHYAAGVSVSRHPQGQPVAHDQWREPRTARHARGVRRRQSQRHVQSEP